MEYSKDFEKWNMKKKALNASSKGPFVNEGEIWWCSLGINIGVEMDGKNHFFERPVLIIKKINLQSVWMLPLTSNQKENPFLYPLKSSGSSVSISQMRSISTKRLSRRESKISLKELAHIIIRIKYLIAAHNETSPNHIT